ncbi:MAG: endolytic transglycosylase MltG [Patescibacteria group bacterium]|nr:endolytic transglycosylase MltG [Patescibacteria group bacterium]
METPSAGNYYILIKKEKRALMYGAFFILVFLLIFFIGYFCSALFPVSKTSDIKNIEIKENEGFGQISMDLERSGIIRSGLAFQIFSLLSGSAHKLKPGDYSLDASLSAPYILNAIVAGPDMERRVVIPPGFTLLDIDKKLSDIGILTPGTLAGFDPRIIKNSYEFLNSSDNVLSLEGYLFPDTYNFLLKSDPKDVVKKFLDNFSIKVWPHLTGRTVITGKNTLSPLQVLTVASLIEKEAYFDNDRPLVAGIIYNRLRIGMPLQIDAAIIYAKCGGFMFYCNDPIVLKNETKYSSPYNTYLFPGLPPGPIGNPGLESIEAALNPQSSDFLYYISDPKTHKIIPSKTLDEQNNNRIKYLGI